MFPALRRTPAPTNRDSSTEHHEPRVALRWLAACAVLAMLLVVAMAALALRTSRDVLRQRGFDAVQNTARSLAQAIDADLGRIALSLHAFAQARGHAQVQGRGDAQSIETLLADQQTLLADIDAVRLTDAEGNVLLGRDVAASPGTNVADRDYFALARDGRPGTVVVSEPVFARISRQWVVVVSRRLEDPDGRFAGVVYATLTSAHFDRLIAPPHIGPQGAISVRSAGLRLIARRTGNEEPPSGIGNTQVSPQLRDAIAASPGDGTYVARTVLDNVERFNAYQRVGTQPLYVLVGLATDDYLAPWHREVLVVGGLTGFALVAFSLSSLLVARAWRRVSASTSARRREAFRHRALMRTASDGIHVLDREGRVVEVSDAFAQSLGYAHDELVGRPVTLWDAGLDEPPTLAERLRGFGVGERVAFSGRQRRRDGTLLEVQVAGIGVSLDGQELLYCAARDVTERRRAERALRATRGMLDRTGRLAGVGGWTLDLRGGRMIWSDETCRLLGVPPGFAPTLARALEFFPSPGRERLDAAIQAALNDGTPWDLELPLVDTADRRRWVRTVGERDMEDGLPVRLVGAILDVSDRRRLERHAGSLEAQLQRALAGLDELRLLAAQPAAVERADTGIDALIASAVAELPADQQARIVVERRGAAGSAAVDARLVRLALRHLLSNALQFSPPGTPVTLRIDDDDGAPGALRIDVVDLGPGLPDDVAARPFAWPPRAGDAGQGLPIVHRVAALHGGRVELASRDAGRTVVRLVIPPGPARRAGA